MRDSNKLVEKCVDKDIVSFETNLFYFVYDNTIDNFLIDSAITDLVKEYYN